MRSILIGLLAALALSNPVQATDPAPGFDAELAAELGADDYGMRKYVLALLKAGPIRNLDADTVAGLQRGHMEHMRRMAEDGKLVLAGPFLDGGELRGVFVFAVESLEEAESLAAADPAVAAGRLSLELHPWYGSAALMKVGEIHSVISRLQP